jgi:hypothetical protein
MVTVQKERETREEIVYMYHSRTYAGNPNDLYSVDELKDFYVYNKTQGFPCIQPDGGS